jgi:hypothetical protein
MSSDRKSSLITEIASFEAFMAVMFQVTVFWVATQCSAEAGYQHLSTKRCHSPENLDLKLK